MSKIFPIVLLVVSVAGFFQFIDPLRAEVQELRNKKSDYENVLARARQLQDKKTALQNKYNSISKSDRDRLEELLPDALDNVGLVLDIDQIASRQGLRIKSIAVSGGKSESESKKIIVPDNNDYGVATITFSVSASYEVFLKFLSDLEDGLRIVDITNLTISPREAKVYDYNITFKTYWLKK